MTTRIQREIRKALAAQVDDLFEGVPDEVILKSVETFGPMLTVLIAGGVEVVRQTPTTKAVQAERSLWRHGGAVLPALRRL